MALWCTLVLNKSARYRSPRQATPYQFKQNRNVVKGESRKAEREKGVLARPLREPPFYTAIG